MKKSKIIIIVLSVVFVICCIVLGWMLSFKEKGNKNEDNSKVFNLSCDSDTITKDKEVVCTLKGTVNDYEVSAVSATIVENNNFELVEVTPNSYWEGDGDAGDIDLYTAENKKGNFEIVKFKISLIDEDVDEIEININENSFFDKEFLEHKVEDITKKIVVEK